MEADMAKLHELQEKRAATVAAMREINSQCETEKRDYSDAENTKHKELKSELTGLDKKIEVARDLQEAERSAPAILHSGRLGDGQYETRARQFSLLKAINARLGDVDVDAGFEREISQEVVRRSGRRFNGIPTPDQYFDIEKRTLLVGSTAATLFPLSHRDDLFIDSLRARLIVGQLGATILDNLVGDNEIPRQTGSSTAQWVSEDAALSETDATFDDITLSPKTCGAVTSFSRRTLINALPSIENIVRNDLASIISNEIDKQAMLGTGASNTPTGVANASGINSATLATPTWAQVLAFVSAIQGSNAEIGSMAWAMAPRSVAKLRSTVRFATTDSVTLMESVNTMAGYPVAVSTALSGLDSPDVNTVLFGAWSQLLVGYWSGIDILPNPYDSVSYLRGRVMIRAMRDVDVAVRHGQSFAKATNLPT
jgi:HK97 family phage major capsid protein